LELVLELLACVFLDVALFDFTAVLFLSDDLVVALLPLEVVWRVDLVTSSLLLILLSRVTAFSVRFALLPTLAFVFLLALVVAECFVLLSPAFSVADLDVLVLFLAVAEILLSLLLLTASLFIPFLEEDLVLAAVVLRSLVL
jgi:hypothetical protein